MNKYHACLALTALLGSTPILAESQANLFDCRGEAGIAVHFTSSSILGVPTLSLGLGGEGAAKTYPPDEISVDTTDGQIVVTVVTLPGGEGIRRIATLVLPAIAIADEGEQKMKRTTHATLIETVHSRDPDLVPENQDLVTKTTHHELTCEARWVVF